MAIAFVKDLLLRVAGFLLKNVPESPQTVRVNIVAI